MNMELQENGLYGAWACTTLIDMPCDRCSETVKGESWRFILDDGKGPDRPAKHHGKRNSYMCEPCANGEGYELSKHAYRRVK